MLQRNGAVVRADSAISRRHLLWTAGLTALGATGLTGCSNGESAEAEDDNLGFAGVVLGYPLARPTVDFVDASGEAYNVSERTAGKLTLMLFGYTSCPDVCPVHLSVISNALEKVPGPAAKTTVIMVGCDTARDTPEVLRTYLDKRNEDFVGLTADATVIDDVLEGLQLPPIVLEPPAADGSYVVGHPSQILAYTPDDLCHILYPFGVRAQDWVKDLPRLQTFDWPVTTR